MKMKEEHANWLMTAERSQKAQELVEKYMEGLDV